MQFGPYSFEASHTDKVLFPDSGLTKGDLIDYYVRIADHFIRHAADRPLAMHRFPDGIRTRGFFQKEVPDYFPEWVQTVEVHRKEEGPIRMVLANNTATLAYLANQATIAPHLFLSSKGSLDKPDKMLFDLDPPDGRFDLVVKAAKELHKRLENAHGLTAFVMTTGSRGMHVVVPLRPEKAWEDVREFAREVCDGLADEFPDSFTTEVRKEKRKDRLFLDFLRNAFGQHSIAPYGVRALPGAPVATPLKWDEIDGLENGARTFTMQNLPHRLEDRGDAWKGFGRHAQSLQLP